MRGQFCLHSKNLTSFLKLSVRIPSLMVAVSRQLVLFWACKKRLSYYVWKKSGVLVGGHENFSEFFSKSVVSTMSRCHTWTSLFQVT